MKAADPPLPGSIGLVAETGMIPQPTAQTLLARHRNVYAVRGLADPEQVGQPETRILPWGDY